ncbi:MAG: hypothetical protein VR69_00895 [Peptococcaceae bacterium BRH_c4b]|nr:MAG: hypothetical protein VR69_00895 [Peptococcaceae bacterium BRH_c4b]
MTLRTKTLVIIGFTLFSLIVILYFVSQAIMLNSFVELEERVAKRNVNRACSAICEETGNLNVKASDWSAWDDTYGFIENTNNEYMVANLNDKTFQLLSLNFMLFFNNSGELVFGKGFNLNTQKSVPVPDSLREHITAGSRLLSHTHPESSVTGFLLLPEGPLLLASRPIVTSENKGPIRGTLIMGCFLESKEMLHLAETTHLSLTFKRADDVQLPQDFQRARSSLTKNGSVFIQRLNSDTIAGYCLLQDIYGKPALLFRVDMPRDIYKHGQANMRYAIFSFLAVGLIIAVINLLIMEKTVLSRLVRLSSDIRRIGASSDLSDRVSIKGRDELSGMAGEVNKMLESLEHSQQQLQESEELYRNLFETMAQGVVYRDADGRIISANPAAKKILGLTVDCMQGRTSGNSFRKAIREDGSDFPVECRPAMIALTTGQEVNNVIIGVYNPWEDQYRWINVHAIPMFRQGDEKPYQVYTSFEDITERMRMEEELKKHRDYLEEAVNKRTAELTAALAQLETACASLQQEAVERMLAELSRKQMEKEMARLDQLNLVGEMAASIGHEVRNPMTTVRGFLQLLSQKEECKGQKEFFELMIEELDRANAIITEFLTLAKDKAVQRELKNLNEMIETLIPLIKADATLADNYVRFQLEEVPYLLLDEKEIRQLILNLVRNGLEAMSPGGYLTIKTYVEENEAILSVQDEGTGIEPDVLDKIGTPFFTTKEYGSGLGLAVCYSIASRHNATIRIETGRRGTTFYVRFKPQFLSVNP